MIRWIEMGMVDPSDFISHVIDKENILDGFEILEKKQPAKKIVIKY